MNNYSLESSLFGGNTVINNFEIGQKSVTWLEEHAMMEYNISSVASVVTREHISLEEGRGMR